MPERRPLGHWLCKNTTKMHFMGCTPVCIRNFACRFYTRVKFVHAILIKVVRSILFVGGITGPRDLESLFNFPSFFPDPPSVSLHLFVSGNINKVARINALAQSNFVKSLRETLVFSTDVLTGDPDCEQGRLRRRGGQGEGEREGGRGRRAAVRRRRQPRRHRRPLDVRGKHFPLPFS